MIEAERQDATEYCVLFEALAARATNRKRRLFMCADLRRSWHLLREPGRRVLEVAERFADGLATPEQLGEASAAAWRDVRSSGGSVDPTSPEFRVRLGVRVATASDAELADAWSPSRDDPENARPTTPEMRSGLELLREVVGNPFRTPALDPAWLAWKGGIVPKLARAAYDERRLPEGILEPARLAVLADALEDAGCTDAELLGHLRGPGPHVRGCWALDLVTGKA